MHFIQSLAQVLQSGRRASSRQMFPFSTCSNFFSSYSYFVRLQRHSKPQVQKSSFIVLRPLKSLPLSVSRYFSFLLPTRHRKTALHNNACANVQCPTSPIPHRLGLCLRCTLVRANCKATIPKLRIGLTQTRPTQHNATQMTRTKCFSPSGTTPIIRDRNDKVYQRSCSRASRSLIRATGVRM